MTLLQIRSRIGNISTHDVRGNVLGVLVNGGATKAARYDLDRLKNEARANLAEDSLGILALKNFFGNL